MKTAFALFLVLAVALVGIAPSISLAENPSNYVVLKGGIYSPSKDFNLNNINVDSKTGFDGEIAIGHYFLPVFATELGAEGRYLWAKPSWGGQDIKLDGFTVTADPGFRFQDLL